jgi:hypothetical protein
MTLNTSIVGAIFSLMGSLCPWAPGGSVCQDHPFSQTLPYKIKDYACIIN